MKASDYAYFWLAVLVGWATSPRLWLRVGGPFRWAALLAGVRTAESGNNGAAVNRSEPTGIPSLGWYQFQRTTIEKLKYTEADAADIYRATLACADYVSGGTAGGRILYPWMGYSEIRYLWTHGSAHTADRLAVAEWWSTASAATNEKNGLVAFVIYRLVFLSFFTAGAYYWVERD